MTSTNNHYRNTKEWRKRHTLYYIEMAFGHRCSRGELLPLDRIQAVEELSLSAFRELFSGAQLYHCGGTYEMASEQPVIEPYSVIVGYTQRTDRYWKYVVVLSRKVAAALDQKSVLLIRTRHHGTMHFVTPPQNPFL